jgi:hypothetical protein
MLEDCDESMSQMLGLKAFSKRVGRIRVHASCSLAKYIQWSNSFFFTAQVQSGAGAKDLEDDEFISTPSDLARGASLRML